MQSRRFMFVLVAVFLLPAIAQSQCLSGESGSLKGVVRSSNGQGVSGVRATLLTLDGIVIASRDTGRDGSYEFRSIPGGAYQVQISRQGKTQWQPVHVCNATLMDISLERMSAATSGVPHTVCVDQLRVPDKARKAYSRAIEAYLRNRLKETEVFADKAIEIYPRFAQALTLRGVIRLTNRRFAEADQDLLAAIQADPGNHATYVILAESYNAQGRFDEALEMSKKSITLWSDSWLGYYELARSMVGKRQYASALEALDKTEQTRPTAFSVAHVVRAYALAGLQNYREASLEIQHYLAEDPNGPGVPASQELLQQIKAIEPGL